MIGDFFFERSDTLKTKSTGYFFRRSSSMLNAIFDKSALFLCHTNHCNVLTAVLCETEALAGSSPPHSHPGQTGRAQQVVQHPPHQGRQGWTPVQEEQSLLSQN